MRAKSIKNKARVNTEMSPTELKVLLSKTKGELVFCESYRDALLGEVAIWRVGGTVSEEEWATEQRVKMLVGSGGDRKTPSASTSNSSGLSAPTLSRSSTPGPDGLPRASTPQDRMDADERDDFLRRENELNDVVAEKESALNRQAVELEQMRKELDRQKVRSDQLAKVSLQPCCQRFAADWPHRIIRASHSSSRICAPRSHGSRLRLVVTRKAYKQPKTEKQVLHESLSDCDVKSKISSGRMLPTWRTSGRRKSRTCWQT